MFPKFVGLRFTRNIQFSMGGSEETFLQFQPHEKTTTFFDFPSGFLNELEKLKKVCVEKTEKYL